MVSDLVEVSYNIDELVKNCFIRFMINNKWDGSAVILYLSAAGPISGAPLQAFCFFQVFIMVSGD